MQEVFEKIKNKCQKRSGIGRSSLVAFLEILDEVAEEYNNGFEPALDILEYGVDGYSLHLKEQYQKGYEDAKKEYNNGWIPVEERLPNEKERLDAYCRNTYGSAFIVMIEGADKPTTLYIKMNEDIWFDDERNFYNVTAWQPLPDPYQPKGEKE